VNGTFFYGDAAELGDGFEETEFEGYSDSNVEVWAVV
jgi:hypothetical protein